MSTKEALRRALKEARTDADMSLRTMSAAASEAGHRMADGLMCRVENGQYTASMRHIAAVSAACGTTPAAVLRRAADVADGICPEPPPAPDPGVWIADVCDVVAHVLGLPVGDVLRVAADAMESGDG